MRNLTLIGEVFIVTSCKFKILEGLYGEYGVEAVCSYTDEQAKTGTITSVDKAIDAGNPAFCISGKSRASANRTLAPGHRPVWLV